MTAVAAARRRRLPRRRAQLTAAGRLGLRSACVQPSSQPRSALMFSQAQSAARAQPLLLSCSHRAVHEPEQTAENGIQEQRQRSDQSSRSLGAQTQEEMNPKRRRCLPLPLPAGYPRCSRVKRITAAATASINKRVCGVARTRFHAAKAKTEPPPVV